MSLRIEPDLFDVGMFFDYASNVRPCSCLSHNKTLPRLDLSSFHRL